MSTAIALMGPTERHQAGAPAPAASGGVEIVRNRETLDALAPEWAALEAATAGLTLFQGIGWARAVFEFEAGRGNAAFDPVVVALREGGRLVALLPLECVHERGRTVLAPLGQAFGQYADMLVMPDVDAAKALQRLIKTACVAAPCDAIHLLKVRDGSSLMRGLPDGCIQTGVEQGAPFVGLGGFADFEAYFKTIKSKTRKNLRNARNRLEREGTLVHVVAADSEGKRQAIARSLKGRAERLKTLGLTSRAFRSTGFADFCMCLADRPDVELMASTLLYDGEPLAEQWGFVHRGSYYAFVASRDFSNSEESPGRLHLAEVLRACAERGLAGCDLGVPVMPYKLTFATETVAVRDYALPVSLKGRLFISVWDVRLRPWLKALVLKLPSGLRTRLMKAAGIDV